MEKGGKQKSKKVTDEGRIKTNNGKILSKKTNAKSRKIRVREEENLYIAGRIKNNFQEGGYVFQRQTS